MRSTRSLTLIGWLSMATTTDGFNTWSFVRTSSLLQRPPTWLSVGTGIGTGTTTPATTPAAPSTRKYATPRPGGGNTGGGNRSFGGNRSGGGGGRGRGPPQPPVDENRPVMNAEITAAQLRVVTPVAGGKDQALGVMSRQEALQKAQEMGGLDLIMINDKSDPPVCKIVDYSKYRYMQEKKAKEIKKNSKANELKEVKMSYKIDVHDYEVRVKNASKFIKQGNRVKATVMFRGREVQHDKLGFELLEKLAVDLDDVSIREGRPKREGRNLSLILGPRAEVMKAVSEERKLQEKLKKQKKKQMFEERQAQKAAALANGEVLTDDDFDDEDFDDDDDDDDDDDEDFDDDDDSLDDLLGSDELIDDLFSPSSSTKK